MYRNLEVWKEAYSFGLKIYKASLNFPKVEIFGLTSQIRRSATSIAANIAEGNARESKKEFKHFLYIARGSAAESETWLMYSKDLNYISGEEFTGLANQLDRLKRMLFGLIKSLDRDLKSNK